MPKLRDRTTIEREKNIAETGENKEGKKKAKREEQERTEDVRFGIDRWNPDAALITRELNAEDR